MLRLFARGISFNIQIMATIGSSAYKTGGHSFQFLQRSRIQHFMITSGDYPPDLDWVNLLHVEMHQTFAADFQSQFSVKLWPADTKPILISL